MPREKRLPQREVDDVLKAIFVFSRTVEHALESRVLDSAGRQLSKSKVQILRLLGQRGSQTSTQISRFLGTSKPAVTQLIDAMVKDKLVSRVKSTRDRRGVVLSLTAAGRKCFQKVRDEQRQIIRNTVRLAPTGDLDHWVEVLEQMAGALARADRAFQHFCMQCGAFEDGSCVLVRGGSNCLYLHHRGKPVSARTI